MKDAPLMPVPLAEIEEPTAWVRADARQTEIEAAELAKLSSGGDKRRLYDLLIYYGPKTVDFLSLQMELWYGRPDRPNQYQSRIGELRRGFNDDGARLMIVDTGKVEETRTGAEATVWAVRSFNPSLVPTQKERCPCCGRS